MGTIHNDKRIPRLTTGFKKVDEWIDGIVQKIERNSNITASPPLQVRVGPTGIALSMAGTGLLVWAKSKSGGITGSGGKAAVTLQDYDGSTFVSQAVDVEAINMGSDDVGATKLILLALVGKYYFVIWENCT